MPRQPRAFVEGIYHVTSHASDTRWLFPHDADRELFLDGLRRALERFELRLVAYTLMGNHYHAVLSTPGGRISAALQRLHAWYSRRQNSAQRRSAHLFRAHPSARAITSDEHLLTVCRYVALNPVEAGLAVHPFDWPWSSCSATAGLGRSSLPLDTMPLKAALGDASDWQMRYRAFITDVDACLDSA